MKKMIILLMTFAAVIGAPMDYSDLPRVRTISVQPFDELIYRFADSASATWATNNNNQIVLSVVGIVKVAASDTNAATLSEKIQATNGFTLTVVTNAGEQTLMLGLDPDTFASVSEASNKLNRTNDTATNLTVSTQLTASNIVGNVASVINVKAPPYNAVGDGVADDTAAIQSALDDSINKTAVLPDGDYLISSTLTQSADNSRIAGLGRIVADSAMDSMLSVTGTNVAISDVRFDGNAKAVRGIQCVTGSQVVIDNVELVDFLQPVGQALTPTAIRILGETDVAVLNVRIDGVSALNDGNSVGIYISPSSTEGPPKRVLISGGSITNVTPVADGDAIRIQNGWTSSVNTIVRDIDLAGAKRGGKAMSPGSVWENVRIHSPGYAGMSIYASDTKFSGHVFNHSGDMGIEIGTSLWPISNIWITASTVIRDAGATVVGTGDGIRVNATNVFYLNVENTFIQHARHGIYVTAGLQQSELRNNFITDVAQSGITVDGNAATYYPVDMVMAGNRVENSSAYGVRLIGGTNLTVFNTKGNATFPLVDVGANVVGYAGVGNPQANRQSELTVTNLTVHFVPIPNGSNVVFTNTALSRSIVVDPASGITGRMAANYAYGNRVINDSSGSSATGGFIAQNDAGNLVSIGMAGTSHSTLANRAFLNTSTSADGVTYSASGGSQTHSFLVNGVEKLRLSSAGVFADTLAVTDDAYGAGWDGSTNVPTKNALYDKIESLAGEAQTPWTSDIDGGGFSLTNVLELHTEELYVGTLVLTNALGVGSGGSGKTSVTANRLLSGNGTSPLDEVTIGTGLHSEGSAGSTRNLIVSNVVENALLLADNTTNNATASRHGFLPKLSGNAAEVLKGDGTWGASGGGSDADAIHVNASGEIDGLTDKTTPVVADRLVIEDSEDSFSKKDTTFGEVAALFNIDNAIHDNVAGEINAITEKASPVSADLVLIEDSEDSNNKKKVQIGNLPGGGGIDSADVKIYTTPGTHTWTNPAGGKFTFVTLISGGGGGGSGRKGAAGTARVGGGGGGGGGFADMQFSTAILGATETVTVGGGGTGGASVTADSTSGANGANGTNSSFGAWLKASAGTGGAGGGEGAGGTAGTAGQSEYGGGNGNIASLTGGSGSNGANAGTYGAAGGGGGGGITAADSPSAGGNGGTAGSSVLPTQLLGGTGGSASNNGGTPGAAAANQTQGGGGGAGGGGRITAGEAGDGSAGGQYGAGGGGGGAALNATSNSGDGGNGGNGIVIVVTVF